jgi:hypothetical protein
LQVHFRALSVAQRRTWCGELPDRFRRLLPIVVSPLDDVGDGVDVDLDLTCDVLRV